ncbi:MAG: hypothetical protein ACPG8W_18125 [Candidatus Promineifilaceae bacterium]
MNESESSRRPDRSTVLLGCAAFLVLFACILMGGMGVLFYREYSLSNQEAAEQAAQILPTATATMPETEALIIVQPSRTPRPTAIVPTATPTTPIPRITNTPVANWVPIEVAQRPSNADMHADLERMWRLDLPPYDYYEVAVRLGQVTAKRTIDRVAPKLQDVETFKLGDSDGAATSEVSAELASITENAYFWIEEGFVYNPQLLRNVSIRFESDLYPKLIDLFGQEWRPGIDGDPHIHIVHLRSSDEFEEIGFFNSVNQYPVALDSTSNEREMVFLNMDQLELGSDLYFATLVHEIQHLIQWNIDPNETVWLNEGMSQLAEIYLGFETSETIDYLDDTSVQLNTWQYDGVEIYKHYAASYLFMTYVWEQLGTDAVRDIVQSEANGLASLRQVLSVVDPATSLEMFMLDWATANLLDDGSHDLRHGYDELSIGFPDKEERIEAFPFDQVKRIPQFGVHYIDIRKGGTFTVTFAGDTITTLLPTTPPVGNRSWFAPSTNDVASTLTKQFDLTGLSEAVMTYAVWYELELDFDFTYVEISVDNGQNWEILEPLTQTPGVYGPAYSGYSHELSESYDGWLFEAVSLTPYVGQNVLIRFETLSDGAFSERGFAVTNIQIPAIGYTSDVDRNANDWEARGFAPVGSTLPQLWSVAEVENGIMTPLPLNELNNGQWLLSASIGTTLVIMPQTPFVDEGASYWLRVERASLAEGESSP